VKALLLIRPLRVGLVDGLLTDAAGDQRRSTAAPRFDARPC
jgi:hypothetical protein